MAIDIENPGADAAALKEAILDLLLPQITADEGTVGQDILLNSGTGTAGRGGHFTVQGGFGTTGGGNAWIVAGAGTVSGGGASAKLESGYGEFGHGGTCIINSGSSEFGNAGDVAVTAGSSFAANGDGGDIILTPGDEAGAGVAGVVKILGLSDFADDAAAATGGVPVNGVYRNGSVLMVRVA